MTSLFKATRTAIACALIFSASAAMAGDQQRLTAEQTQIVSTVSTIFKAVGADDLAQFDSVIAPGFYLFDGGLRFDGDSIVAFLKTQQLAGRHFEWNVTEPDVHIIGNTAWIAYINKGSITDASGTTNQQWLESAFLQKQSGAWKIVFMHSTRIPVASHENRAK